MKILIVAPAEEEVGGVQYVIENLTRHLKGRGDEVFFFYSGSNTFAKRRVNKRGFASFDLNLRLPFGSRNPIFDLALFLICFPVGLLQLLLILRRNRIEVVNVHYPTEAAFYFAVCRLLLSIRLVTSAHGADLFPGGRPISSYPRTIRFLLSHSDRVVAPSGSFLKDVLSQFPFLNERMTCIHNGVNLEELSSAFEGDDHALPARYILCIAMHNEKKGLDVLLRAFALLRDAASPELRLVLVGDGPLRGQLEALALSLRIKDTVEFLGRKSRREVALLIQNCEVFVLPSRSEPFGIVLVEAMACKKPVVSTVVGGIPEIVENGKNGILVQPDDPKALAEALSSVLRNQDLRQLLANNGFSRVHEKFSIDNTGAAYATLFADLVHSPIAN